MSHESTSSVCLFLFVICMVIPGYHGNKPYRVAFTVTENMKVGDIIGNLPDALQQVGFKGSEKAENFLIDGMSDRMNLFSIDSKTGSIKLSANLDRERVCPVSADKCELNFMVSVGKNSLDFVDVRITVVDLNDNPPRFLQREKTVFLEENSPLGRVVPLPTAQDIDSEDNGVKRYRILPLTSRDEPNEPVVTDYFQLDIKTPPNGGRLVPSLKLIKDIDREQVDMFRFHLVAIDSNGLNGTLLVTVKIQDVNDNAPVWQPPGLLLGSIPSRDKGEYSLHVRECSKTVQLFQLRAVDADDPMLSNGKVDYMISEHSPNLAEVNSIFYISGDRLFLTGGMLHAYGKSQIKFSVTARDGMGRSTDTLVTVNVDDCNDKAPSIHIKDQSPWVTEHSEEKTVLTTVSVVDRDKGANSNFSCTMDNQDILQLIKVVDTYEPDKGRTIYYKVETKPGDLFDREKISRYTVQIHCRDAGSPPMASMNKFYLNVKDINDNSPVFKQPLPNRPFYIEENMKGPSFVGRVIATDNDSEFNQQIRYELDKEGARFFSIDGNGNIDALQPMDREAKDRYEFTVIARDQGKPPKSASTTVTILVKDVNDNPPVFDSDARFEMVESFDRERKNKVLGVVSTYDKDEGANAFINYRIISPTTSQETFQITQDGTLTVSGVIDREVNPVLRVTVLAFDSGRPSLSATSTITIHVKDLNDNKPRFKYPGPEGSILNVSLNTPIDTILVQLKATDPDEGENGTVQFFLPPSTTTSPSFPYTLYPDGRLVLTKPLNLIGQPNPPRLLIRAKDSAPPPYTQQTMDTLNIIYQRGSGVNRDSLSERRGGSGWGNGDSGGRGFMGGNLMVFYLLAVLLLIVFLAVCSVLGYIYCKTRHSRPESHKQSRNVGRLDITSASNTSAGASLMRHPESLDKFEKDSPMKFKSIDETGQASAICVYNETTNSYTHLTTGNRSTSYTCLPPSAYDFYATGQRRDTAVSESPYGVQTWNHAGSPTRGRLLHNLNDTNNNTGGRHTATIGARSGTLFALRQPTAGGNISGSIPLYRNPQSASNADGSDTGSEKRQPQSQGEHYASRDNVADLKSAHSYAFLDAFREGSSIEPRLPTDGKSSPPVSPTNDAGTCARSEKRAPNKDWQGFTAIKTPHVTSSFV